MTVQVAVQVLVIILVPVPVLKLVSQHADQFARLTMALVVGSHYMAILMLCGNWRLK